MSTTENTPALSGPDAVLPSPSSPWVWLPPALAAALLALVYFGSVNTQVFLWINRLSRYTGPSLWSNITIFGDALVAVVLLLPWLRRRPDVIWAAVLAALLGALWTTGIKDILDTPRPPAILAAHSFTIIGPTHLAFSFPSGHATTIFTLMGVWVFSVQGNRLRASLLAPALLVAVSRMVVGVHWPVDVLGGALFGWLCAWLGVAWARYWHWGLRPVGRTLLGLLLAYGAYLLLMDDYTGYEQALLLQKSIGGLCAGLGLIELLRLLHERRSGKPTKVEHHGYQR